MRALTVRQPWAWAIMHGGKDVENRSRNIAGSYRGPIAITASLTDDESDPAMLEAWRLWWDNAGMPGGQRGYVLGVVDLVEVHHCSPTQSCLWASGSPGMCSTWAFRGNYHLTLENPRPLPTPIPIRGRLGLWTLPDDIAAQVEEALR